MFLKLNNQKSSNGWQSELSIDFNSMATLSTVRESCSLYIHIYIFCVIVKFYLHIVQSNTNNF